MWMKLLKEYPGAAILHIGDNEHSDVQIPSDMGIPVYHVMSPKNLFHNSLLGREFSANNITINVADAALMGLAISHLLNNPFSLNKFEGDYLFSDKYDFGYSVIGPIIISYLLWIVKSAIKERFSTIYFLAREGYLLKRIFDSRGK